MYIRGLKETGTSSKPRAKAGNVNALVLNREIIDRVFKTSWSLKQSPTFRLTEHGFHQPLGAEKVIAARIVQH